jgi:hypothetical protein
LAWTTEHFSVSAAIDRELHAQPACGTEEYVPAVVC